MFPPRESLVSDDDAAVEITTGCTCGWIRPWLTADREFVGKPSETHLRGTHGVAVRTRVDPRVVGRAHLGHTTVGDEPVHLAAGPTRATIVMVIGRASPDSVSTSSSPCHAPARNSVGRISS